MKGRITKTGYRRNSPDVGNDFNIIPSNRISMRDVDFPVLGIDNLGNTQLMHPGGEYEYQGDYVTELPMYGSGGLTQWFAEEWVDIKTGKKCGRSGKDKKGRPYPACRPSKRVNKTTPKTKGEMSASEKAKFKRKKKSGKRIDYNHKRAQLGIQVDPEMLYRDRYNTELTASEKKEFDKWVAEESKRQGRDILMDMGAYDVQGFWKSGDHKRMDQDNHGTDTWKKPNHPTFSNQSKYHGADGFYGGNWKEDGAYQPSKQTLELYGTGYYDWMFGLEPNRPEYLDTSRYESGVNKPTPLYYKKGGSLSKAQFGGRPGDVFQEVDTYIKPGQRIRPNWAHSPVSVTNYTFGKTLADDEPRFSLSVQGTDILDEIKYRADAIGSVGIGVGNRKGKSFRPAGENLRAGIRGQASWQGVPGNVIENMFGRRSGLDWRGSFEGEAGVAYANGAVRPYMSVMPQTNVFLNDNLSLGIGYEMRGRYDKNFDEPVYGNTDTGSIAPVSQRDGYSGMGRAAARLSLNYDLGNGDFIEGYYAKPDPLYQGSMPGIREMLALESDQPRFGIRLRKSFAKGGALPKAQEGNGKTPLTRREIFNVPRTMAYEDGKMVVQDKPIWDGMLDEVTVTPYTQNQYWSQYMMDHPATGGLTPVYPVFDLMTLGIGTSARAGARYAGNKIARGYNKVATGNSALPIAWKMEDASTFVPTSSIKTTATLTDKEAKIIGKYLQDPYIKNPGSFNYNPLFDQVVQKNKGIYDNISVPFTRVEGYASKTTPISNKYGSTFSYDGSKSWSLGARFDDKNLANLGKTRLVIPSRYSKNLDFMPVDYTDARILQGAQEEVWKSGLDKFAPGLADDITRFMPENEIIGNVPNGFKVIGRSNEQGFNNIFIKPVKALGGSLPSYQTRGEVNFQSLDPRLQNGYNSTDATYVRQNVVDPYIVNRSETQRLIDESVPQTATTYVAPSPNEWLLNKAANPVATLGYIARGQRIPDKINNDDKETALDYAFDIINPAAWANYAVEAEKDFKRGDVVGGTLNAIGAIPAVPAAAGTATKATFNLAKGTPVKSSFNLVKTAAPASKSAPLIGSRLPEGVKRWVKGLDQGQVPEYIMGLEKGINDVLGIGVPRRPFFEAFPVTRSQRLRVQGLQDQAALEAEAFVKAYTHDGTQLQPWVVNKLQEWAPGATWQTNLRNQPHLRNKRVVLTDTRPGRRSSLLTDYNLAYINQKRSDIGGFANMGEPANMVTFRNQGWYFHRPSKVANVVAHEGAHGLPQSILDTRGIPLGRHMNAWNNDLNYFANPAYNPAWAPRVTEAHNVSKKFTPNPFQNPSKKWEAAPIEFDAEKLAARFKLYKDWQSKGANMSPETFLRLESESINPFRLNKIPGMGGPIGFDPEAFQAYYKGQLSEHLINPNMPVREFNTMNKFYRRGGQLPTYQTQGEVLDEVTVTASAMEPRVFGTGYQAQGEYDWNKDYTQYYLPINLNNAGGVSKNELGDYVFNKPGRLARQVKREFKNQFGVNPRGIKSDFSKIFSEPFESLNSVVPEGNNVGFSATRPSLSNSYYTNPYDDQLGTNTRPGEYLRGYISNDRDALLNTLNLKGTAKDFKNLFSYTHGFRPYLSANHAINLGPDSRWRKEAREFKKGMVDNAFIGEEEVTTRSPFESNMINYLGSDTYFERLAGTQYADEIDVDKWSTDEAYRVGFANRLKSEKPELVDQTYASLTNVVKKPVKSQISTDLGNYASAAHAHENSDYSAVVDYNPFNFNTPFGGAEQRKEALIKELESRGATPQDIQLVMEYGMGPGMDDNFSDVMAHELAHVYSVGSKDYIWDNEPVNIASGADKEYEFLWNMNQNTKDEPFYSYQNHLNTGSKPISYDTALNSEIQNVADRLDTRYHNISPEETKADVYGIRNYLLRTQGQDYDQPFTKENYESLMNDEKFKEGLFYKRMQERYGDDQSKWMKAMNLIASKKDAKDYSMYAERGGQLPKAQEGNGEKHTVASGETFYGIANKHGLEWQDLVDANPDINPDKLSIGQSINLPGQFNPNYVLTSNGLVSMRPDLYKAAPDALKNPTLIQAELDKLDRSSDQKNQADNTKASGSSDYFPEALLLKQAYKESTFNPAAKSNIKNPAQGFAQFRPITVKELQRLGFADNTFDPFDYTQSIGAQRDYMNYLYTRPWVDKPDQSEEVRLAKTLAAYNWGPDVFKDFLTNKKAAGVDIYNSLDWVNQLPGETGDYINKILLDSDEQFQADYQKAIKDTTNSKYINLYNLKTGGESLPAFDDYDTFDRAWLAARKKLGRSKKFMYGGKVRSTDT